MDNMEIINQEARLKCKMMELAWVRYREAREVRKLDNNCQICHVRKKKCPGALV